MVQMTNGAQRFSSTIAGGRPFDTQSVSRRRRGLDQLILFARVVRLGVLQSESAWLKTTLLFSRCKFRAAPPAQHQGLAGHTGIAALCLTQSGD